MPSKLITHAVCNLNFEYELAYGPGYPPKQAMLEQCKRWRHLLKLLPQAKAAICIDSLNLKLQPPKSIHAQTPHLLYWGASQSVQEFAQRLGSNQSFPPLDAVKLANDKRYSHELERELNIALPFSQIVTSPKQLELAINSCPYPWVLKHPLGVSATEQTVGKARQLTPSAANWAQKRLQQGWSLIFEPWLEYPEALSLHFDIDSSGYISFIGHCQILTNGSGVFRGNRVTNRAIEQSFVEAGQKACKRLAGLGYWGPVGIDALKGKLDNKPIIRPIMEINARFSFGRMALELRNLLPKASCYSWLHPSKADRKIEASPPPLPIEDKDLIKPGLYSLPTLIDPEQNTKTILEIV